MKSSDPSILPSLADVIQLHFNDPDAFEEIHVVLKCKKHGPFYSLTPESVVSISDPQEASRRRTRIGSYFSRRAVLRLEDSVQKNVDKLIERLPSYNQSVGKPANLHFAFRCTTLDIITAYLFSQDLNALNSPDYEHPCLHAADKALRGAFVLKCIPYSQWAIMKLPQFVIRLLIPSAGPQLDQTNFLAGKVDEYTAKANTSSAEDKEKRAVFDVWLRTSEDRQDQSGSPWTATRTEIIDECMTLQIAGSDTVGNACMIGAYHLLNRPEILEKLQRELVEAWPDAESRMKYEALEKLPYLTAVIKESLRLSYGVVTPLPRVIGPTGAVISGQFIPPNTVVGCGAYIVHNNASIFENPTDFIPERWIGEEAKGLEKYLLAFSKGPRICLGINLAWCELYLIFANVFRKLDLEIFNTTEEVLRFSDYFVPIYTHGHLKAFVKRREEL
ncbi:hypothetical protein V5O48_014135 [Marasmius crinis-equi]|uniref:Cytochrome P450 n=1 Tax=Marasmius crinis-equi TaxID=585013 RepID=A0ABR3EYJ9_9AGAR